MAIESKMDQSRELEGRHVLLFLKTGKISMFKCLCRRFITECLKHKSGIPKKSGGDDNAMYLIG